MIWFIGPKGPNPSCERQGVPCQHLVAEKRPGGLWAQSRAMSEPLQRLPAAPREGNWAGATFPCFSFWDGHPAQLNRSERGGLLFQLLSGSEQLLTNIICLHEEVECLIVAAVLFMSSLEMLQAVLQTKGFDLFLLRVSVQNKLSDIYILCSSMLLFFTP